MAGLPGNKCWTCRTKHGRNYQYPPTEDGRKKLRADCLEYFEQNGTIVVKGHEVDKPFTLESLTNYIGTTPMTWTRWRNDREDLSSVVEWADNVLRAQKLEQAIAGNYNGNVVSKILGLADKIADSAENTSHEDFIAEVKADMAKEKEATRDVPN